MEFLIQEKSQRIYVKTEVLAKRKDMRPYEWPTPELVPDDPCEVVDCSILVSADIPLPVPDIKTDTPGDFCKRVFGKHITKVTKTDINKRSGKDINMRLPKSTLLDQLIADEG